MAKDASFDLVSEVNLQKVDDCVNVAMKEITNRFDFKNTNSIIEFNRQDKKITLTAPADFQIDQMLDILNQKFIKQGLSIKTLKEIKREDISGNRRKLSCDIICGIETEMAKIIIKKIKDEKFKVQMAIQDEQIRVSAKSKDELQKVIQFVKEKDFPLPLQFTNYR